MKSAIFITISNSNNNANIVTTLSQHCVVSQQFSNMVTTVVQQQIIVVEHAVAKIFIQYAMMGGLQLGATLTI